MVNNENLIPIPGRLHSVATEGHVAGADEIYDDTQQKDQETINSELITAVGTGGSVDSRIAAAVKVEKTRAEGAESALDDKITTEKTRAEAAEGALDGRVDTLEEAVGTGGSVDSRISAAVATETTRAQAAEADRYTKSETYTKEEVNGLVDTPHQEYVTVEAYTDLRNPGSKDTIYRVSNYNGSTSQVDASVYSEYAWNGSQYIFLCVKSQIGEVFDISVYNNNAKYADLAAALNGGANIPQSLQKGGMSVKFVQSSDNKYVQYRFLLSGSFTDTQFATESNWVGIANTPIDEILNISNKESITIEQGISNTYIDSTGKKHAGNNYYVSAKVSVKAGELLSITAQLGVGIPIISKVYNEDYDYYKPLVASSTVLLKEYRYLIEEDCYIVFNYYQSDIPVVTRIRSESLTEALSLSIASGILNVGVTYLNPTWANGYYYDPQGVKTENARYRISTPISVCAGDKITAKAYFISGLPVAVYTDASGNTESVAFSADSTGNKEYTFYADRNGYISFSHLYDSNDNYYLYSYIIESQLVKKVVDRFYAIIQGVEATIPNKVLDDIADITEGESITIEVGKSGYVIDGSGNASASQNYSISKGIEVEAGDILTINSTLGVYITVLAYQYGEDSTYYDALIISDSSSQKTYKYLVQKAGYVVFSYLTSTPPTVTRTRSATISKALTEADTNSEYLDVTKEYVYPTLTSGYLYFPDGSKVASSSYSVSSPVSVNAGDKIVVYLHNLSSPEMAVAVYTNADGSVNGANGLPLGSACNIDYNGYKVYTFIADRTGYISFCCYQSRFRYAYIIRSNALKDELSHIEKGLINKDNETRFYALSDNPIERIKYTAGMTSIIRSWGFIGDSLASGVVNYNTPTSGTETLYDYSWGQMLCRLTGATGYNFSYGGQYAKRWITSLDEGTSYQREPERCWQGAKTNLKDAYVIALGENDMASLRDVYTEGSVSTDAGTYDPQTDTDTNANSFAGWMAGIIQRIQSVQPKAPIFLVTMPKRPAGQELRMAYNTVIRDLVEHFSNVYLIDVYTYGPDLHRDEYLKGMFFNGNHMNAIGYQWFSYLICTYIDWIIRHNPSAFRNQQFVGTNYSYSI